MSDLETENMPLISCLMQDIALPLDPVQQSSLALWAIKSAMVFDSVKGRSKPLFYDRLECVAMREHHKIPEHSRIWIGRSSVDGLGAYGTDLVIILPEALTVGVGFATTIIVGHLAVQILSTHISPEHGSRSLGDIPPKPGLWDEMLYLIWPAGGRPIAWPPPVTFTAKGERSIATLMDRWRLGIAV